MGLLMRSLFGVGTPKGWADAPAALVFVLSPDHFALFVLCWNESTQNFLIIQFVNDSFGLN